MTESKDGREAYILKRQCEIFDEIQKLADEEAEAISKGGPIVDHSQQKAALLRQSTNLNNEYGRLIGIPSL